MHHDSEANTLLSPTLFRSIVALLLGKYRRVVFHEVQRIGNELFLDPRAQKKLHAIAWLDGLRGIASLLVVIHHASLLCFSWKLHSAWLPGEHNYWIQLPFIRLILSGKAQVAIFFAVSGYSLSIKPQKLANRGRFAEHNSTLSSSIFRRFPRLMLPTGMVMLCTLVASWFGIFEGPGPIGTAIPTRPTPKFEGLKNQLLDWPRLILPIRGLERYDPNLWTIPIEFHTSMFLFLIIVMVSRMQYLSRIGSILIIACYSMAYEQWDRFLFLGGMFACELHYEDEISPRHWLMGKLEKAPYLGRALSIASLATSLHLLCTPNLNLGAATSPGYISLLSNVSRWWHGNNSDMCLVAIGAVLLVITIEQSGMLQRIFTTRFAQYLGRISFALYLVHGPLIWSLGRFLILRTIPPTDPSSETSYFFGIMLAAVFWWPVVLAAANLTSRFIDEPSIKISRCAYNWFVGAAATDILGTGCIQLETASSGSLGAQRP